METLNQNQELLNNKEDAVVYAVGAIQLTFLNANFTSFFQAVFMIHDLISFCG